VSCIIFKLIDGGKGGKIKPTKDEDWIIQGVEDFPMKAGIR
jgi:hypothetical protein